MAQGRREPSRRGLLPAVAGLGEDRTSFPSYFETNERGGDSRQPPASPAIDRFHPGVCRSQQHQRSPPPASNGAPAPPQGRSLCPSRPRLSLSSPFLGHLFRCVSPTLLSFVFSFPAVQRQGHLSGLAPTPQPQTEAGFFPLFFSSPVKGDFLLIPWTFLVQTE